jgi:hypothetical protein
MADTGGLSVQFGERAPQGTRNLSGAVAYRDDLVRIVVDVPDTPGNRLWMKDFKVRWRGRLEQLELWVVSYRIEVE